MWRVGYVTTSSDLRSSDVTAFPSLVELWKHASSETAQALLVEGSVMEELAQPPLGSVPARVPPASIIVVSGYAVRSATTTRPDSIPTAQIDLLACLKRMMRATWARRAPKRVYRARQREVDVRRAAEDFLAQAPSIIPQL